MPEISENGAGPGGGARRRVHAGLHDDGGVRLLVRCWKLALLCVLALIGTAGSASAAGSDDVYVSASGTDANGCGTRSSPCATLSHALTVVLSGGTIHVDGTLIESAAATIDQDVTIAGVAGTDATIEGSGSAGLLSISGGDVSIEAITLQGGNAGNGKGGAIYDTGSAVLTVTDATFAGNRAGVLGGAGSGGAIEDDSSGALTISGTTFAHNSAGDMGGAIDYEAAGSLSISDSTFADDSAGYGGAIFSEAPVAGQMTIVDSTFANDTDYSGRAIDDSAGFGSGGVVVAGDVFGNGCDLLGPLGPTVTDDGYNAGIDGSCMNGGPGDDTTMTAGQLGALADNGGPTETVLPLSGNPAIGRIPDHTSVTIGSGSVSLCPLGVDQRGALAAAATGTSCDAGAVQTAQRLTQAVTFASPAPTGVVARDTRAYTPVASASSGETVTYAVDSATTGAACTLDHGTGAVSFAHAGSCVIDAVAAGDADYVAATAQERIAVARAGTSTIVTGTANELTVTVVAVAPSDGTPTGTVSFAVGGRPVGTATLSNGVATVAYTLPAGNDEVTANYDGDSDYEASQGSTTVAATATSTAEGQPDIWGITITRSTVRWCIRYGCPYPDASLRFHLGKAAMVRLVLLARTGGRWHVVGSTPVRGHAGANRYRIAGRWHGQLVPARRVEMRVRIRHGRRWRTVKTLHLIVEHGRGHA